MFYHFVLLFYLISLYIGCSSCHLKRGRHGILEKMNFNHHSLNEYMAGLPNQIIFMVDDFRLGGG